MKELKDHHSLQLVPQQDQEKTQDKKEHRQQYIGLMGDLWPNFHDRVRVIGHPGPVMAV